MLAITLAMMTTLLTLGMLVFSATQAISSFGIVLVSGIFTAFLLAPLAMPDKKERNVNERFYRAAALAAALLLAGCSHSTDTQETRPQAGSSREPALRSRRPALARR